MMDGRLEVFCENSTNCTHYMQDQDGNIWAEVKDGATHVLRVCDLPKLIEQAKHAFELTIETIPHNDKDCLVTFKKLG